MEEDDLNKLYDSVLELNKKISELDGRNAEIESFLSSLNTDASKNAQDGKDVDAVIDQESTIVDPYNIGGHKSLSLPNGGVVKLKSRSFCVNGRHVVNNVDDMLFCSRCNAIVCRAHAYELEEQVCSACLKDEIKEFDSTCLYLLFALKNGIPVRKLKHRLNASKDEMDSAISKLKSHNCVAQDMLFRYRISIRGEEVLNTARILYDFSFLEEPKQGRQDGIADR